MSGGTSSPSPVHPNTAEAVDFLSHWHPEGWNLVAIVPDGRPIARSFNASEKIEARDWIDNYQGKANIYFHVNELHPGCRNRKAKKSDIARATGLHVDVDDLNALPLLRQIAPRPTVTTNSGGGFQAFWKLPVPSADLAAVEACNAELAERLGGDNCHNIDRLMRVPGTINVPNRKKRERGRKNALAYVVEAGWDRLWPLEQFDRAGAKQKHHIAPTPVSISAVTLSDLPGEVIEFTRALIAVGDDPDRPRGSPNAQYRSRSEILFRVVCDLVRAECSDELILGMILNPDHGVSASVLEKDNPSAYAERQLASARAKCGVDWPDMTQGGHVPRGTYANTLLAIRRLEIATTYDRFHNRMYLGGQILQSYAGELTDNTVARLRQVILTEFQFDPGKDHVRDALLALCLEHQYHPILTYLDGLKWDGIERLPTWLMVYLGAEDTPLNREIGQIVLVAGVRRIRRPGHKYDTILVLEGPQGSGKSTALVVLSGPENFSDQNILALDSKAQMEALEGVWIFELSELEGLTRTEIAKVKAFVSRFEDRGRPAYGRYRENHPRQTIFIGTTNDDQYLRDQTGNRRFWPVLTGRIDLDGIRRDRDQLWAEAAVKESLGLNIVLHHTHWAAAGQQQQLRMEDDGWSDLLRDVVGEKYGDSHRVASAHLMSSVLGIPSERLTTNMSKRVAHLMRRLGWFGPGVIRFPDGKARRGYLRPAAQGRLDLPPKT